MVYPRVLRLFGLETAVEGYQDANVIVATFDYYDVQTGISGGPFPANAEISIDWGDGSTSEGTAGSFSNSILGHHTYTELGTYTVTVRATVGESFEAYALTTLDVRDAPLTEASPPLGMITTTVGEAVASTLGSFHYLGNAGPGDFRTIIDWGDSTTSEGSISLQADGSFVVAGSHTYLASGWHTIGVRTAHDIPHGGEFTTSISVFVKEIPPESTQVSVTPASSGPAQIFHATFTTDSPNLAASDFAVVVDWGDGTTTQGTVTAAGGGSTFNVDATHTYSEPGTYDVSMNVTDSTGASTNATTSAQPSEGTGSGGGDSGGGDPVPPGTHQSVRAGVVMYGRWFSYLDAQLIQTEWSLIGGMKGWRTFSMEYTQPSHGEVHYKIWRDDGRWALAGELEPGFYGEDEFSIDATFVGYDGAVDTLHVDVGLYVPPPPTLPAVTISDDVAVEEVSVDFPRGYTSAIVSSGTDSEGDPIPVADGTVIEWRLVGATGGSLEHVQSTTTDGIASNQLNTSTLPGDTYHAFARVVRLVTGGSTVAYAGRWVEVGIFHVVPGAPDDIDVAAARTTLPADDRSTTTVTLTVTDSEGNPVADGTPLDITLSGPGTLIDADDVTTQDGRATVTVRAGLYAGPVTVTARAEGATGSVDINVLPLTISLGITGNAITLGSDEEATVTAHVTDSSGNPVADGTPITWLLQKGGFSVKSTQVLGGVATMVIKGKGGSQVPGNGLITASVGSTSGSKTYLWVAPAGVPFASVAHPVLAGDQRFNGAYQVEQVDGTTKSYDYYTSTSVTIANAGSPGDVVTVRVGDGPGGGSGVGALAAVGDNGQPASLVTVTVNAAGQAVFQLQSLGTMPSDRMINVPISLLGAQGNPSTTFNVLLEPAAHIARTADYIGKLGYGILAGPGDSLDEIAADVGFSMIPVVGVYSDVRDMASELLKLWPGGQSPDWVSFGFAAAGILSEVVPPADFALDAAKGVAKLARAAIIKPGGYVLKTTVTKVKELGPRLVRAAGNGVDEVLSKLDEFFDDLYRMLPPPFGPNNLQLAGIPGMEGRPFISLVDDLAESADDVTSIQSMVARIPGMDGKLVNFTQTYGKNTAQRIADILGKLDGPLADALAQGGKLDIVAKGMAKAGWDEAAVKNYAKQVKDLGAENLFVKQIDELANVGPEPVGYFVSSVCAKVNNGGARGIWDTADSVKRGDAIAYLKGQNLPQSFPNIDYWDEASGLAKGMKSMDPTMSSFVSRPQRILEDGKRYVDEVLDLTETTRWSSKATGIDYKVDVTKVQTRALDLFIPTGTRLDIRFKKYLDDLVSYGLTKGMIVNVVEL